MNNQSWIVKINNEQKTSMIAGYLSTLDGSTTCFSVFVVYHLYFSEKEWVLAPSDFCFQRRQNLVSRPPCPSARQHHRNPLGCQAHLREGWNHSDNQTCVYEDRGFSSWPCLITRKVIVQSYSRELDSCADIGLSMILYVADTDPSLGFFGPFALHV